VNNLYFNHIIPQYFESYDREKWSQEIDIIKTKIKKDASPGVPHVLYAARNDTFMQTFGERFNDVILDRIENIMTLSVEDITALSRRERIDANLMDPVRVFVKDEGHKLDKLKTGRLRLIMSVSLTDKIIEMLLSRHVCKGEIENWKYIPSKPGIGFDAEDNLQVYTDVMCNGHVNYMTDMQGWDWSVKEWMIVDEAEGLVRLAERPVEIWADLLRKKAILESASIYMFSDGEMVQPNFTGIVNSGKFRTSRGNSYMRVSVAHEIGASWAIAMGDDCIESEVQDAPERYKELGLVCRDYERIEDQFDFCSRRYYKGGSYALNEVKMLLNILHTSPKNFLEYKQYMMGFEDELQSSPHFERLLDILNRVGYHVAEMPYYEVEGLQNTFKVECID